MAALPLRLGDVDEILTQQNGPLTKLYKVAAPNTTIVNRALVTDFSKDLLPKFGITRFELLALQELQGETGASGERVFKALNDIHDQVRFVGGGWTSSSSIHGPSTTGSLNTDYFEVVFYGTGFNLLAGPLAAGGDWRASVDGGAEGANFLSSTISAVLNGRNTASNSIVTVTSGLTLGTHTVKVRLNSAGTLNLNLLGFEVVGPATLNLSPGTSYVGGRKLTKPALTTDSYNSNFESGTLGSKGGHAVAYQKSDGSVGKAVQPADVTPLYLASTNHVNESVTRPIGLREFGAGRTDDFSYTSGTGINLSFTLDDGTTSLLTSAGLIQNSFGQDTVAGNGTGSFVTITFVGTGLDIIASAASATPDSHAVTIDGVSVGSLTTIPSASNYYTVKICSGLAYGTHTVKITRSAAAVSAYFISRFIIYAPSKPAIPTGAVELADYYLMANYVVTSAGVGNKSSGVLTKESSRELIYTGTWGISQDVTNTNGGFFAFSSTAASSLSYTFFGTGIELRMLFQNGVVYNNTFTLNGNALTTYSATTQLSTGTITGVSLTSAGVLSGTGSGTNQNGGVVSISGLPLGLYTLKMVVNNSSNLNYVPNLEIITPVHSPKSNLPGDLQNTLTVGSCAIGDSRKFALQAVKAQSNWSQAVGVISGATITTSSYVPLPDMEVPIRTSGNPLEIYYNGLFTQSTTNAVVSCQIYVDGIAVGNAKAVHGPLANYQFLVSDSLIVPVAPGNHIVQIYWTVNTGTGTAYATSRNLKAREL